MDRTKQLIHIKQLFLRAENISRNKDDISLIMLAQMLDFVVETLLKLVIHTFPSPANFLPPQRGYYTKISQLESERYKQNMDFYRSWDEVVGILRDSSNILGITDLSLRRDMDRLHEIRNDTQHKGATPNEKDLTNYVPLVRSFLSDCYQDIFGEDFEKLSALSLIQNSEVRIYLEKAYQNLDSAEWTNAVCNGALAFYFLLKFVREKAYTKQITDNSINQDTYYDGVRFDLTSDGQKQLNSNLKQEIERLKDHIATIGFGIDYIEYVEIEPILPQVNWEYNDVNGAPVEPKLKARLAWEYSQELKSVIWREYSHDEAKKVVTFVERQALRLQA